MTYSVLNDPEHWRQRAEEARAMAEAVGDSGARKTMMGVAAAYDEMAKKAEQRILLEPGLAAKKPIAPR